MGIRLTGFSTPVIGVEWEYTDKKKTVRYSNWNGLFPYDT